MMELAALQGKIRSEHSERLAGLSLDYGVARLLVQSGQLGQAVLNKGDVEKELADVLFLLASLAHRCNVDLASAAQKHIAKRSSAEIVARIDAH
jgi:NTP pyrophosphatase (non-canonical NTP hydrolase)